MASSRRSRPDMHCTASALFDPLRPRLFQRLPLALNLCMVAALRHGGQLQSDSTGSARGERQRGQDVEGGTDDIEQDLFGLVAERLVAVQDGGAGVRGKDDLD